MGTVPTGIGELRRIHSRVLVMSRPVDRSMTVSAPQRAAHTIFSTSRSIEEATAELPMLALTLTRKASPMTIGSVSGWLRLAGMTARPAATSSRTFSAETPSRSAMNSISRVISPRRAQASWVSRCPRRSIQPRRSGGRPRSTSVVSSASVYGPDVS